VTFGVQHASRVRLARLSKRETATVSEATGLPRPLIASTTGSREQRGEIRLCEETSEGDYTLGFLPLHVKVSGGGQTLAIADCAV
jgi:hypothetical protein